MQCEICNFDSNGNYVPIDRSHFEYFLESGRMWLRLKSGSDITQAIARGCWICRTIRDALLPFNRYLPPEWHCKHDHLESLGECKECLRVEHLLLDFCAGRGVKIYTSYGDSTGYRETFYIIGNGIPWPRRTTPPPTFRIRYPSNISRYPGLDQARAWLDRCTLEHSGCQQSSCSPKRLLKIRDTLYRGPSVKLYSPGDSTKKYACLSYCWGRTGNLETLADNLQRHFNRITFSDLPKTIQDAVRICLALQIYYLWVDALCIVQDDETDWASECMRMGDIYSGAHITLAAVKGRDSQAGLLHVKPVKAAQIKVWPPIGSPTEASVHRASQHSCPNSRLHRLHLKQRPLLTRGWVYQESLLSPRILRFDVDELSFECREGTMCECGLRPDVHSNDLIETLDDATDLHMGRCEARRTHFSHVEKGLLSHSNAFTLWYRMVEQYSSMALTKQSDRLPAFSAIASKFQQYGGRYYAGIWEKDFIYGFQWYRDGSDAEYKARLPSTRTGPSWSWASQPGSISYSRKFRGSPVYSAEFSINSVTLSNRANTFGSVSNGCLGAVGRRVSANLKVRKESSHLWDEPYVCELNGRSVLLNDLNYVRFFFDGRLPYEDERRMLSTENSVCCFILAQYDHRTYALLLRVVDEMQGLYQRIGLMEETHYIGKSWFRDAEEVSILIQ